MARRVFVTGASRGIGAAIAARYAAAGYAVWAPSRDELDLADLDALSAFVRAHGGLDVDALVLNAAINPVRPLAELSLADWQRTLDVNLSAAFLLMQAAAGPMARRGGGRVVAVSSSYAILSRPGRAAYAASKAGLGGLVRTAALEFAADQVLVNAVAPGFADTDLTRRNNPPERIAELQRQIPLGRLQGVDEIAEAVFFLGSDANRSITGQTLVVDGGFGLQ